MSDRDSRFVVAGRPVNRRTAAPRDIAAAPKVAPVALERARAAQARHRLGPPLVDQLRVPAGERVPLSTATIGSGVVAVCGALGLVLSWLNSAPLAAVASAVGLACGLLLLVRRKRPAAADRLARPTPLFDPEAIEAFDRAVQQLAAELPMEVVQPLTEFKQRVLRMARHPGGFDEHFVLEDRLYCNECLRRYVPDSLQGYLAVSREQRGAPLADGQSAEGLLLQQLALLQAEMEKREARLARGSADALLRQQRFLEAKR